MPNTKSVRKSLKVSIRRNKENRQTKLNIRKTLKEAVSIDKLPEVFSTLDKAAKSNVIHPNKAARLKSRASKKLASETPLKPTKTATKKKAAAKKPAAKKTVKKTK